MTSTTSSTSGSSGGNKSSTEPEVFEGLLEEGAFAPNDGSACSLSSVMSLVA